MSMRKVAGAGFAICAIILFALPTHAQWASPDPQEPSDPADVEKALTGGVPMGRWKEGLVFEGIEPMPWLTSAANWFPNAEQVQPNEMRFISWVHPRSYGRDR